MAEGEIQCFLSRRCFLCFIWRTSHPGYVCVNCQCLGHFTYSLLLSIPGQPQKRQRLQQHHWQLKSLSQGCKHLSFSKSPFLKPNSALASRAPLAPGAQDESPVCGVDRSVPQLSKLQSLMVNKGLIICVIFPNYQRKATSLSPPRGCGVKHSPPW